MTHSQTSYVKNNWLSMANFGILIVLLLLKSGFTSGAEVTKIKNNIKQNSSEIVKHEKDEIIHRTYESEAFNFVPRVELNGRLDNLKEQLEAGQKRIEIQLNRMEKKIDRK